MTELYIDDKPIQLSGNEEIALSYAIASIGNIAERNGFKSTTFQIIPTQSNIDALSDVYNPQSIDVRPYRRLKARLFVGGIDQQVRFAEIRQAGRTIQVQLFGGNTDFYTIVKNNLMEDLDLSDYDHIWNVTNAVASRNNDEGYIYPIIQYGKLDDASNVVEVPFTFPAFYEMTAIEEIITQAGYSFSGSIFDDADAKRVIVPFANDYPRVAKRWEDERYVLIEMQDFTIPAFIGFTTWSMGFESVIDGAATFVNLENWINQTVNPGLPANIDYDQPHDYIVTVKFTINVISWVAGSSFLLISGAGAQTDGQFYQHLPPDETGVFEIEFSFQAGQFIEIVVEEQLVNVEFLSGTVEVGFSDESLYQADWNAEMNLPIVSQAEFIKDWMNRNALLMSVDEELKKVNVFTLQDVIDNTPNAKDWSEKIDTSIIANHTFQFGAYGQRSNFKYKEDQNVAKPIGTDSFISIDDKTLPGSVDVYDSIYAASEMVEEFNDGVLVPEILKFDEDDKAIKTEPRILVLNRRSQADSINYTDGTTNALISDNIPYCYFINPLSNNYNLGFGNNVIPRKYQQLTQLLDRAKVIDIAVRIDASDILTLDFTRPIWLDKYSAYFYISEIKQYVPGKGQSTIVELVKLT
jgi:hypothetical protein